MPDAVRDELRVHTGIDRVGVIAKQAARRHADARTARRDARLQIAITGVLAVVAVLWVLFAAREARADIARHDVTRMAERRERDARDGDPTARRIAKRGNDDQRQRVRRVAEREDDDDGRRPLARDIDDDDDAIDAAGATTLDDPFGSALRAPVIAEVLAAAYRTAGLDRDLGSGFARRARLAGLVPWLSVRTGRDTSWRDDEPDVSRGVTIEVRATWRLDRLVFDGRELQVAALEAARRRERRRLAARVIQVYFAWQRAAKRSSQPRFATRAAEAAAELDDLTDGWFTESREALRRNASETRTP